MRKKKHEDHENHERWLVSYADFMTLLFAFFVVLWSQSKTDKHKLDAVIDGMQAAFNGGALSWIGDATPLQQGDAENASGLPSTPLEDAPISFNSSTNPTLQAVRTRLQGSLSDNVVQIGLVDNTLTLVLPEQVLFESGSATIHPSAFPSLTALAEAVEGEPVIVDVVGHADGTPISAAPFGDNWGLASARSVATVRFLSSRGVDLEHLSSAAELVHAENPERRSVTLRIRTTDGASSAGVLDKVLPGG
ncbi:flagellar basal body stator protein MotB [Deltaproteobacteria bacterium]|nr:flagellar basal body stator protein MotB [Deltaproteobacteria bacterium]